MADFCALCGEKLPLFSKKTLICGNEDEFFCGNCHPKLFDMESLERGKYVLENGKPVNAARIQVYIEKREAEIALLNTYEPETRPCPSCGGTMCRKLKDFRIGSDGQGGLSSIFLDQYNVDLYACPNCGKVELYTANFAAIKRKQELNEQEVVCSCGTRHSSLEECPTCAHHRRVSTPPSSPVRPKNEKKPPWER